MAAAPRPSPLIPFVRAPGAPVAVPLRWEELGKLKSGHDFDIHTTPARLSRLKKDPWAGIDKLRQNLDDVHGKLGS